MWVLDIALEAGVNSCDPWVIVTEDAAKLYGFWQPVDEPITHQLPLRTSSACHFPLLSAHMIRQASLNFKKSTARTYDGWHPQHVALLVDGAFDVRCLLRILVDTTAYFSPLQHLSFVMLPKQTGGFRPICMRIALYQVWARLRLPVAKCWHPCWHQNYFAGGRFKAPQDFVWIQAVCSEAARHKGEEAATILVDMQQFYDAFDVRRLYGQAVQLKIPQPIMIAALAMRVSARRFTTNDMVFPIVYMQAGLPAGCVPTTLLSESTPSNLSVSPTRRTFLDFDTHADDLAMRMSGNTPRFILVVAAAAEVRHNEVQAMKGKLALDKSRVLPTRLSISKEVAARAPHMLASARQAAPNYGAISPTTATCVELRWASSKQG